MSGPKRNPDKLNTIGVVVVGICGAVLAYVTILALQAFYMNDTSEIDTVADYGGQDTTAKSHKAEEQRNITKPSANQISNQVAPGAAQTYRIDIGQAMKLVVRDAQKDPSHLVPALPASDHPTIQPIFGRPQPLATPAPGAAPAAGSGAAAGSAAPAAGAAPTAATPAPAAGATPAGATAAPAAGATPAAGAHPATGHAVPAGAAHPARAAGAAHPAHAAGAAHPAAHGPARARGTTHPAAGSANGH